MKFKNKVLMLSIPLMCSLPAVSCVNTEVINNGESVNDNHLTDAALRDFNEITNSKSNEVLFKKDISDAQGNNYLAVVYKKGGYSLIDKKTQEIKEVAPTSKLLHTYGDKKYGLRYNGFGQFSYSEKKRDCRNCGVNSGKSWQNRPPELKPIERPKNLWYKTGIMTRATYEVDYSWWFKLATRKKIGYTSGNWTSKDNRNTIYGATPSTPNVYGTNGICGYIALRTLLMYNEMFKKAGYFSQYEYENYITKNELKFSNRPSYSDIQRSFPDLDQQIHKNLYEKTWYSEGINRWYQLSELVDKSLESNKNLNYQKVGQYSFFGDPFYWIQEKRQPLIFAGYYGARFDGNGKMIGDKGAGHVVTVYGAYNKTRFLCNMNWTEDEDTQLILNLKTFTHGMYFGLISNDEHNSKLRPYFKYNGKEYTGPEFGKVLSNLGMF